MKNIVLNLSKAVGILAIGGLLVACSQKSDSQTEGSTSSSSITIKGSDTTLPISQKLAEQYMLENSGETLIVTGGGSGVGISSLMAETTDIAQSSRKIKFDEVLKIEDAGKSIEEIVIAYDAMAIVVHPNNKVNDLTRQQLEDIFTGKIQNWSELGGDDLKIIPYSRETSSGTYEFFKESVLKDKNYVNGIMSMPATGAIIQSVNQTPGAIGYVGLAYLNDDVKAINVSYDGENFVQPSIENAKNNTYPVVRPLYFYHSTDVNENVKKFIEYSLSPTGQKLIEEIGFITVK